jgi:hypothetical protein
LLRDSGKAKTMLEAVARGSEQLDLDALDKDLEGAALGREHLHFHQWERLQELRVKLKEYSKFPWLTYAFPS